MSHLSKISELDDFGEFKCAYCGQYFHSKKQLSGHIGGAHRKNITKKSKLLNCKKCNKPLIKGKNWATWAIEQGNLICIPCKNAQNRRSYINRKKKMKEIV